ncbi:TPA_asm: hypothetical protein GYW94_08220 [Listeria monocytogenes]|nr:hypothetical protein [Listeria monocytogenes]HAC2586271.1 hypothetical protein [Listeria monocytogenes]
MEENTNKYKDFWVRVLFLIIIFAPISVLIKYNYSWQIVLIGLVASLSFSFICGIDKFQKFKIGKDGVEIIKAVEKVENVLVDINKVVKEYLLLNLLNANKIGIKDIDKCVEEAKKYESIIKRNDIKSEDVVTEIEYFKVNISLEILSRIKRAMVEISQASSQVEKKEFLSSNDIIRKGKQIEPQELIEKAKCFKEFFKADEDSSVENYDIHCNEIDEYVDRYNKYFYFLTA